MTRVKVISSDLCASYVMATDTMNDVITATDYEIVVFIIIFILLVLIAVIFIIKYLKVMEIQKNKTEHNDNDRKEFFNRISHDMRTPMNGILGMIELSQQTEDIDEVKAYLKNAKSFGEYMLSLINDTLDLQQIEKGKFEITYSIVNIRDYLENLTSMFNITAHNRKIEFIVDNINIRIDTYIKLDAVRVKQILSSILSNAFKFTKEGGFVRFSCEAVENEDNRLKIKFIIKDTGIGMGNDFIKNDIYKIYAQELNVMIDKYEGSGLGLAITKRLIEIMNGDIEVVSELGIGTTFTLFLDFEVINNDIEQKHKFINEEHDKEILLKLKGKKILICEDNPINAEITMKLLENAGCELTWAKDGQIGVDIFNNSNIGYFNAVIMDIRMPVMDGIESAVKIRGLNRSDSKIIPIIAMTANVYESDKKNSYDAGMNEHLAKPIEPKILFATLAKYL